jgi:uncharacterized protein (TIGR03083 family)
MTTFADQVIEALRSGHDAFADRAARWDEAALAGPSGAAEWDVSGVLGHLGSGAEINLAVLEGALSGDGPPSAQARQSVWDRWNPMPARERRDAFLAANQRLVERYEGLDGPTRANLRVDVGWTPEPVGLGEAARMRLSEFAYHTWDAKAGADPGTTLAPEAVPLLLDGTGSVLGSLARGSADVLAGRWVHLAVELNDPARSYGLDLGQAVMLTGRPARPDGVLRAPAEAWLRLTTGRLSPKWTPAGVEVSGPLSLDDLRRIFPGY